MSVNDVYGLPSLSFLDNVRFSWYTEIVALRLS